MPPEQPQTPPPPAPPARQPQNLATPIAIVAAGALIAIAIYFVGQGSAPPQQGSNGEELVTTAAQMKALINPNFTDATLDPTAPGSGEIYIGKKDAPVTMTYWFDYQCPFCKQFETAVMPSLVQQYVNTGKLRIVFKNFTFLGNDSITAAEYEHAVWDLYPQKFYQWHTAMYDVQDSEGDTGFGNAATIDTLISLIPGIDDAKVKAQITAHKSEYDQGISDDRDAGTSKGVNGTPAFLIGTNLIAGAEPLSAFTEAIDAALGQ